LFFKSIACVVGVENSGVEREREREREREEKRQDKTRLDERWVGWGPVGAKDGRIVGDWADAGMSG
jgi:hypothetical protein